MSERARKSTAIGRGSSSLDVPSNGLLHSSSVASCSLRSGGNRSLVSSNEVSCFYLALVSTESAVRKVT